MLDLNVLAETAIAATIDEVDSSSHPDHPALLGTSPADMHGLRWTISIAMILLLCALDAHGAKPSAKEESAGLDLFEKRIRPILVEHCYKCHAADSKKIEAGLLLDTRADSRRGGESGAAVVPGKVDKSLIISALEHDDFEMPPEKKLPETVIANFRRWIELGAPDPREGEIIAPVSSEIDIEKGRKFWAFQLPKSHVPPKVKNNTWAKSDIDRFVLAKLEAAGLTPVKDADQEVLIRRATFALIGLPPTPGEIDTFVADKSPDAFAKVVDRLLASEHFGERWARHWLDIARYAESSGGGRTLIFPNAWRYRDYVIRSFNTDKPYDQFLKEQIAGDLMSNDSPQQRNEQLTATGFLALGPTNFELQDKALLRMEVIDEQLDTIGRSMMGMTIGCARCHDHKFDPIPTRDYYALAGILGSTKSFNLGNVASPVRVALASPESAKTIAAHKQKVEVLNKQVFEVEKRFKHLTALTGGTPIASAAQLDLAKLPGVVIDNSKAKVVGIWKKSQHNPGYLGSEYLTDNNNEKGKKSVTFSVRLPRDGKYEVRLSYTAGTNRDKQVPVTVQHAEGESTSKVNQAKRPPIDGVFLSLGTFSFSAAKDATVLVSTAGTRQFVIADAVQFLPMSDDGKQVDLTKPAAKKNEGDVKLKEIAATKKELSTTKKELDRLRKQLSVLKKKAPKSSNQVLSVLENNPRDGHLYIRGVIGNRGPIVPRGVLQVATYGKSPEIPAKQSGRLQMANWIANPQNPLTARVMVNRVWQHLLGEGLVRTPDNFGAMGERPTHPELLDQLALQFVKDDWSVKRLIRNILLTRTYQLASHPSDEAAQQDPENRLLSHATRRRLDAEAIRDAILEVSGKLDRAAYGATMKKGTKSELTYKFASIRRSVYVPSFRNTQLDLLTVFDAANPNIVTGRRATSTLPTQALLLMNSPRMMEMSKHAADKLLVDTPKADDSQRIELLYRRTLGRSPRATETQRLLNYLATQQDNKITPDVAWARVCQTMFACVDFRYVH